MCLLCYATGGENRLAGLLHVGDNIVALLGLLETSESHLGTGNVLLGVLEVVEEGLLSPGDVLLDVGLGVGETGSLAGLAAKDAVQVRADLVGTALEEERSLREITG
jgi:hypothetical protein